MPPKNICHADSIYYHPITFVNTAPTRYLHIVHTPSQLLLAPRSLPPSFPLSSLPPRLPLPKQPLPHPYSNRTASAPTPNRPRCLISTYFSPSKKQGLVDELLMMQDMRPQQGFETLKVTNDCNTMFWLPEFPGFNLSTCFIHVFKLEFIVFRC